MNILQNKLSIQKSVEYITLAYAFTLPLSRAAVSLFSILLILLWLSNKNLKKEFMDALKNPLIFSISIFLIFSSFSLFWSDNFIGGVKYLRHYWYILPVFTFFTYIKAELVPKIISAFLFGMIISEILSYGIFFEIWTFGHATPQDPSPIMNHIHYSTFLAVVSLLLLNRFFFETEKKFKIFYFIYFLLTTSNLFINGGRTGQLAFIFGIFVVGIMNIKNKIIALISIFALTAILFGTAFSISPTFKTRIDTTISAIVNLDSGTNDMYKSSFGTRLGAWVVGIEIFKDHPLLGVGMGSEMDALKKKIDTSMPKIKTFDNFYGPAIYNIKHYHNSYITYLLQMGFGGLIIFLYIFYSIAKLPIKNKEINNLKYIFMTVFMVACFFEQMFALEFPLALFTLFSGIFISSSNQKSLNK